MSHLILPMGFSDVPPASPWGINFGGGLNSTAVIIECRNRGLRPDWILFADTGSERKHTLAHVDLMRRWCDGWADLTVVRWIRADGTHVPLHTDCLRKRTFPSKAYGNAGCTDKWKVQPMDKWRKAHGFDRGAFAVGYDAGEATRIRKACQRGDDPNMAAWYPLVAWGIDRMGCERICKAAGIAAVKSSCFMCPSMKEEEWAELRQNDPDLFDIAIEIERRARQAGEKPQDGSDRATAGWYFDPEIREMILARTAIEGQQTMDFAVAGDRCHHGGCFT